MNICCPCGHTLHPMMPVGRWAMDPSAFLRQNPFPLPLHHAILVSQRGEDRVICPECKVGHEVIWQIVYNSDADQQGGKVRYAMTEGMRFKTCDACGMRWPEIDDGIFNPPVVDASSPCRMCITVILNNGIGARVFRDPA